MSVLELYRMAEAGSRKFKLRLDDSSANDSDEENAVDEGMEPQASSLSTKKIGSKKEKKEKINACDSHSTILQFSRLTGLPLL